MLEPKNVLKKALAIVKLDRQIIKEVAEDKEAFLPALGIVVIGGLLAGIGGIFTGFFAGIIIIPVLSLIGSFIGTGIIFVIAYILGGRGSYLSLYKVLGYAYILSWSSIIPFIGWIPSLWMLVVMVVALQAILNLSQKKAITVGVVLIILWLLIWLLIAAIPAVTTFLTKKIVGQYLPGISMEKGKEEEIGERIAEEVLKKSGIEAKIGKLPKDIPGDIPIIKGAEVSTSMTMGEAKTIGLTTSAPLEEVVDYYKEELKRMDWKIGFAMEQEGDVALSGTKEGRNIQVHIQGEEGKTSITIIY